MIYAIKTHIADPATETMALVACKTMYGGKHINRGDRIFLFANERSTSAGLMGYGIVTAAEALAKTRAGERQTPRVSLSIASIAPPKRPLVRADLIGFKAYDDGSPQSELNFKFYRQATDKIVSLSDQAAAFLLGFF